MKNVTFDDLVDMQNDGKKIVVDFYADWCHPCKILSPILNEVEVEQNLINFVKIDVGISHPMTGELNIRAIPTVILFQGHSEVGRFSGVRDVKSINQLIIESFN